MDLDADSSQLRTISRILVSMGEEIYEVYSGIQIRKGALAEEWHDRRYQAFLASLEEILPSILKALQYIEQYSGYLDQRAQAVDEYPNPSG